MGPGTLVLCLYSLYLLPNTARWTTPSKRSESLLLMLFPGFATERGVNLRKTALAGASPPKLPDLELVY